MVYAHRSPAIAGALPSPLHSQLVVAIGTAWNQGADFGALADLVVDQVAEHIRRYGVAGVDPRIGDAIADAIVDREARDAAPVVARGQLLIAEVVGRTCRACRDARRTAERGHCYVCNGAWPIDDRAVSL